MAKRHRDVFIGNDAKDLLYRWFEPPAVVEQIVAHLERALPGKGVTVFAR
jgi:hypothetical protein